MNQYYLTKTRIVQWFLIILVFCGIAGGYFYYQSQAAVTVRGPTNSTLKAHWKFDEGTGTSAADSTTNANTGTLTNGPTWVQGKTGSGFALNFDGIDDYVDVGSGSSISTSVFTYAAWIYVTGSGARTITGVNSNNNAPQFRVESGNTLGLLKQNVTSIGTSSGTVSNSVWTHVAVTYDSSGNYVFYVNGITNGSGTNLQTFTHTTRFIGSTRTGTTEAFSGQIDDMRIYNSALSADDIATLVAQTKANYSSTASLTSGLIAYWTFDGADVPWTSSTAGTATDISGQSNTGTLTSMAQATSPVSGKIGQGLLFDGSNDCIDAGSQAILDNVPTVTFAFWAYFKATSASDQGLMGKDAGGTNTGDVQVRVRNSGDATNPNKIQLITQTAPSTEDIINSNSAITLNAWTHVVLIFGGSGKSMYINNVLQTATSADTQGMANATPSFSLGAIRVACTSFANVILDDVRIYNRALSAAEIASLYNADQGDKVNVSPTGSQTANLVGYWTFDGADVPWTSSTAGTATDRSGQSNTGTLTNMSQSTSPVPGKLGQALDFDGTNDYISIANESNFDFERTNTLSACAWIKLNSVTPASQTIFTKLDPSSPFSGWEFSAFDPGTSGSDRIQLYLVNNLSTNNYISVYTSTDVLTAGTWHHVCFTYSGSSTAAGVNFYVDSVVKGKTTVLDTLSSSILNNITPQIGQRGTSSWPLGGRVDEVRVYNTELTQAQITNLYNLGR